MRAAIEHHRSEIAALCRRFGVARLGVFGSAMTGRFDARRSDIDFVVEFNEASRDKAFDNYFGLRDALADLFGHPIDLVTRQSMKNPVLRDEIDRTAETVYAEAA